MRKRKVIPAFKPKKKGTIQKADRSFSAKGFGCVIVPPTAKSYRQPRTDTSIEVFPTAKSKPKNIVRELKRTGVLS